MSRGKPKFPNSKFRRQDLSELTVKYTFLGAFGENTNQSKMFIPSLGLVEREQAEKLSMKYFILNQEDMPKVNALGTGVPDHKISYLLNLANFMVLDPKKTIYIREIPSHDHQGEGYFFTEDILEIVPLVLKQQKAPIVAKDAADALLKKYQNEWKMVDPNLNRLVPMTAFRDIMEEFDVNKKLITILPDMEYEWRTNCHRDYVFGPVWSKNRDGEVVTYPCQAIYHLFIFCVCGFNWEKDVCTKHSGCREDYKKKILEVMEIFLKMDKNVMIINQHMQNHLEDLQKHCYYSKKGDWDDILLVEKLFSDDDKLETYHQIAEKYQLFIPEIHKNAPKDKKMMVWNIRALCVAAWIRAFFENVEYKKLIMYGVQDLVPVPKWKSFEPVLMGIVFSDNELDKTEQTIVVVEKKDKKAEKKMEKNPEKTEKPGTVKTNTWRDFSEETLDLENFLKTDLDPINCSFKVKEVEYMSNFCGMPEHILNSGILKYFLITGHKENKTFAIRAIPCFDGSTVNGHILTDDVFSTISSMMQLQKVPDANYEDILQQCQESWKPDSPNVSNSLNIRHFQTIMETQFPMLDMTSITIVPDVIWNVNAHRYLDRKVAYISTLNRDGNVVMSVEQAIFYTFFSVVCGEGWYKQEKAVLADFKKKYFEIVDVYSKMRVGVFITKEHVERHIETLKNHKIFKTCEFMNFEVSQVPSHETIDYGLYKFSCPEFGLPIYEVKNQPDEIPCWLYRAYMILGWIETFYPDNMLGEKRILVEELGYRIPVKERNDLKRAMLNIIGIDTGPEPIKQKLTKTPPTNKKPEYNLPDTMMDIEPETGMPVLDMTKMFDDMSPEMKENMMKDLESQIPELVETFKALNIPHLIEDLPSHQGAKKPTVAQSKPKQAQPPPAKIPEKLTENPANDLEKAMEKMKKEMEEMRKENLKLEKEIVTLKQEVKTKRGIDYEAVAIKQHLPREVASLKDQLKQQITKNSELQHEIERIESQCSVQMSKMEEDAKNKDAIIAQEQEKNRKIEEENAELKKKLDAIQSIFTPK